jgi:branched-chain amino acid transport system substrate-binding protein
MREKKKKFVSRGLRVFLCLLVFGGFLCTREVTMAASADVPPIKIAVIYSLSGALSRNGNLTVQGIKAAINWVNENGGIKSLGGAKLMPIIADNGSTVEGTASATDRVCRDPDILMSVGCWASSFTMAATEVTERLGIPHFSFSFVDKLHERGFKYGFYISPPSSVYGEFVMGNMMRIAKTFGEAPKTAMVVTDNNAAAIAMCDVFKKYLTNQGVKIIDEEIYTMGTMTDATPIMQKVRMLKPDMVIYGPSSLHESQVILMKKQEMGIKSVFVGGTGAHADPSYRQAGSEYLDGFTATSCYPHKLVPEEWIKRSHDQCRKEYSDELWVGQDLMIGWHLIPIMAEILERTGSRDRKAIREVASKLDIHGVTATKAIVGQGMAFDENGRIAKKYQNLVLIQWQKGSPRVVYPPEFALAKPIWLPK